MVRHLLGLCPLDPMNQVGPKNPTACRDCRWIKKKHCMMGGLADYSYSCMNEACFTVKKIFDPISGTTRKEKNRRTIVIDGYPPGTYSGPPIEVKTAIADFGYFNRNGDCPYFEHKGV